MSDPRQYQRSGACFSWESMDQVDAEGIDDLEQECADRERDEWEGLADAPY